MPQGVTKLEKLENDLKRFKRIVPLQDYSYDELCELLKEEKCEYGSKRRERQIKKWKTFLKIVYKPKTNMWFVEEVYEEKLLEKISNSQYYERMYNILFLYLYKRYEENKQLYNDDDISVSIALTGSEIYKLFGLVNENWGIQFKNGEPTKLFYDYHNMPTVYSNFVSFVASFSKTIVDNCLQSLRNKRLINYYIKYEVCTSNGRMITLDEKQTNLLTKIERKVLDQMYDDIYSDTRADYTTMKDKVDFGMNDIYIRNLTDVFREEVCFQWGLESEENGAGFQIKWYRCFYCINAIKGYFERYINETIKNDIQYANFCFNKYCKEMNDISFNKLNSTKKEESLTRFQNSIPTIEKLKEWGGGYALSKNMKIYNELLSYYNLVYFGKFLDKKERMDKKFPTTVIAENIYIEVYEKMLDSMVKKQQK